MTIPFKTGGKALSVTFGDSSLKGRAKEVFGDQKRSVSIPIRSVLCFTDTHRTSGGRILTGVQSTLGSWARLAAMSASVGMESVMVPSLYWA